ncbi:MAG: GNAT family N-acetyltransferase, partial [Chloroflexota bacterium]
PERLPPEYTLRTFQKGDEAPFYNLMALAGWTDWNADRLAPWLPRIPGDGWFMVTHIPTNLIVATAMALASEAYEHGGEIGWVAAHPDHKGHGLGKAVCSAVTRKLIEEGYRTIHLYTEHWRLPALHIYLSLGFIPYITSTASQELWQEVCSQLSIPYAKQIWQDQIAENPPILIVYE